VDEDETQSEAVQTTAGVIHAFRELQDKAKHIGIARAQALTTAHNLRNELSENRRKATLDRSKMEIEATDLLLLEKSNREAMSVEHSNTRTRVAHAHEESLALQRQEAEKAATVAALEDEVAAMRAANVNQQQTILNIQEQTRRAEKRVRALLDRIAAEASEKDVKRSRLQKDISALQQRSVRAGKASMRSAMRCAALEKYMSIILQINGDLCNTIATTEQSRAKIARISAKYMPPRYAWPVRPYTSEFRELAADDEDYVGLSPRGASKSPRKAPTPTTPSPSKRKPSRSPGSGSPRKPGADVPMSPQEFARQMMSANAELDENALAMAIRSMSAVPTPASAAKSGKRAVSRHPKTSSKRGEPGYIPNAPTFSERIRRGQMATNRSAKDSVRSSIRSSDSIGRHNSYSSPPAKPVFMPTGKAGRSQNVIAAVSRASRAAGYLNATIASKVKSMTGESANKGMYGENVRYVTIRDLYGKLSVVKRSEARSATG